MRASRSIGKLLVIAALMLTNVASWLALPGYTKDRAPRVPDDQRSYPIASLAKADVPTQSRWSEAYGKLPLSFEANQGQFDSRVKFVSRADGHTVYLTATEAVLKLYGLTEDARDKQPVAIPSRSLDQRAEQGAARSTVLRMKLIGATPARNVDGLNELPGTSNYFLGDDANKWHTGVKSYSKVRYRSVYPGIDLVYHSDQRKLEYDFNVASGANPRIIRLAFEGATRVRIDKNGELVLETSTGEVRQNKPFVYQVVGGARKRIPARYVMRGKHRIGFSVSRYDRRKPLVIDPVLIYSTYLGGSGLDNAQAVAVDNNGSAYITGSTNSTNFPTANPFQPGISGTFTPDVFVTKLNPTGTALVYSTYLGGSLTDSGSGIALDSLGNAYVTGQTSSQNFPTANPLQAVPGGQIDAFVTKLNPEGSMLLFSSYLGGDFDDSGRGIAVDVFGAAHVTGNTESPDFPLANALRSTFGLADGFVSKFNFAGTALVYSTYLGGSGSDSATAIALDSGGNAYVTGSTRSSDFPTINALQQTSGDKTLFKSTDSGASWALINNGVPRNESGLALAIDPVNTAALYAGTVAGIYKSTDAGGHWMPATQGLPDPTAVSVLAVDPLTPSILYAATSRNVYKSTSSGSKWETILDTFINTSLAIDPASPSTVYVGTLIQGILVTTDGGETWENSGYPFANRGVNSLAFDPKHPGSFYVGTENFGIHRYPVECTNISATISVQSLAVSPASPSTVYVGAGLGSMFKSTDAGANWNSANTGLGGTPIVAIAVDPITPQTVYAASRGRCYKSTDGGDTWISLTIDPQSPTININDIAIDPANPSTLYAAASAGGEAFVTKLNASGGAYVYSTLLGGSGADSGAAIAVDSSGSAFVAGTTNSLDIPSANSLRPFAGSSDLMIARITPDGGAMSFFTYFGGVNQEGAAAISIDSSGNVWVTGNTNSADLPTTPDATPVSSPCPSGSCRQAFVSKFNSDGTQLAYSSYLGGNTPPSPFQTTAGGMGFGVAVDLSGSAYVVGQTFAIDFPTTPGAFQFNSGGGTSDAFVAKIGSSCSYSLSRTSQAFPMTGGSGSVDLTTAAGCGWTAVASGNWISIVSNDSGTGSANIAFDVRENFDERFRIGTLTIAGQTFRVLQEGLGGGGCSNAISPTFGTFPAMGGNGSLNVIANEECIWTAVSNSAWVTITSNDNGIGIGVVTYLVAVNPGTATRTGMMTVAGQTFAIKQKGNVANGASSGGKP